MKNSLIYLILLAFGAAGFAACAASDGDTAAVAEATDTTAAAGGESEEVAAINVKTLVIQPEAFDDEVNVVGTVQPMEEIMVAAEEGGKVNRWLVRKGSYVRQGQALVKLNDDLLRAQLDAAEAQLNVAKLNSDRQSQVFADAGAVTEVQVKTSTYNVDAAQAQVTLLKARIAKTSIPAPIATRVEEILVDVGEMAAPGAPVARLIQTGVVKVVAGVPERYADEIRVGMPVVMRFDALDGRQIDGTISYIGAKVSQRDRTIPVEIHLNNGRGEFVPEMIAEVKIVKDRIRNVVVVPRTAIVRVEDGYEVYVVVPSKAADGGYVVQARPVKIGQSGDGSVVVTEGLKIGERIVTIGQSKVNPGERVVF